MNVTMYNAKSMRYQQDSLALRQNKEKAVFL